MQTSPLGQQPSPQSAEPAGQAAGCAVKQTPLLHVPAQQRPPHGVPFAQQTPPVLQLPSPSQQPPGAAPSPGQKLLHG